MTAETLDWKLEPLSPPLTSNEDATLCSEDLYWTEELIETNHKNKLEIVTEILENLDNLEDLDEYINGNEDVFSNYWMEDKVLPLYEEPLVAHKPSEVKPFHQLQQEPGYNNHQSTQSLLTEFQNVFDSVNGGSLTPPQSPPHLQPTLITLQPPVFVASDHTYPVGLKVVPNVHLEYAPATPQTNVNHELALVDELVRARVETMVPSSPSSSSSASSNYGDSSSSEDPEWSTESSAFTKKSARHKTKPYTRNNEDKKSRKKEQNKNAATRYRLKKKAEVEEILGEEKVLMDARAKLEGKIGDLQGEIKCLKNLMRDLFKAKGLIK